MGKFFIRCPIWMKFGTRVRLKPSNDGGEFEPDQARSKNNIPENSFALGHETHNTVFHMVPFNDSHACSKNVYQLFVTYLQFPMV